MKIQLFALVLFGLLMWGAVFLRLQSGAVERRRPVVHVYDSGVKTDLRGARNRSRTVKKDDEGVSNHGVVTILEHEKKPSKPIMAVCACTRSKPDWKHFPQTAVARYLIPSLKRTVTPVERDTYDMRLYICHDDDDMFWERHKKEIQVPDWLTLEVLVYKKQTKHKIPFNPFMRDVYESGAEYMTRINDDTEFVTSGWVSKAIAQLKKMDNVGVVGPTCHVGNTAILTHDMVHRTHLEIFDTYYSDVFSAWWVDDWITRVYEPGRMVKMRDWVVKHHTGMHGTRYTPQMNEEKFVGDEVRKGQERLKRWLQMKRKHGQSKYISYSLYGSNPRYTDGALANAKLVKQIYPGWRMRVYYDRSVPQRILNALKDDGVELIDMSGSSMNKRSWRFLAAVDSQRFCARDIDSRLSMREAEAVKEWIESGKKFHVMRDHPSHSNYAMSAGMWCATTIPNMEKMLHSNTKKCYTCDQIWLTNNIWPLAQKSLLQHDSFSCDKFGGGRPFPTPRKGWEHVGSVYIGGKMRQVDVDILKNAKQPCVAAQPHVSNVERTCFPHAKGPKPPRKGQVTDATSFGKALTRIASREEVKRIIEIGTWFGGGSTQSFVDGIQSKSNCISNLTHHCCEAFITTFEVYQPAWEYARMYHQDNPVWLVLGTSVKEQDMLKPSEIPENEKGEHYRLYYERDRKIMSSQTPKLKPFCRTIRPDVVLIDGNEYTGWGEFNIVTSYCKPKWLALHDTGTLKTHKVEKYIRKHDAMFQLESNGRDGASWSIYRVHYELPFKIIVLTQRREKSLKRLLESLNRAEYSNEVHLEIRIDFDESPGHQKVISTSRSFVFKHGKKSIHIYKSKQGLRNSWFNAWTPHSDNERAVIIEDDMELSPLWFKWLSTAWHKYGTRSDIGGMSLCRQRLRASDGASIMKQIDEPFLYKIPGSFGFSPHAKHWKPFVQWVRNIDLLNVNIDVPGTVTTQWHRNTPDSWEQYWIWWCFRRVPLYTLYVHSTKGALIAHWAEPGVHATAPAHRNDIPLQQSERVLEFFPTELKHYGWDFELEDKKTPTIWSNDFHISTIGNVKKLLGNSARFIDKSLSGHCHLTKTCATDLKVLTKSNGISPNAATRTRFVQAYKNDPEMKSVDIVMCFHPSAMCELFMPLDKRLFVIATTRYEMGRESKQAWQQWNENLKRIAEKSSNLVAANNLYDAKYIEYFTGIQPRVIPSWIPMKHFWTGVSADILIAPIHSPSTSQIHSRMKKLSTRLKPLKEKYEHYTFQQLSENTAIVHIPYQTSVMSLFEQYGMGIPILVPSPAFLWELHDTYDIVSERTWKRIRTGTRPSGSILPGATDIPDPNDDLHKDAFLYWIRYADYYQWPHIIQFGSWEELERLIASSAWTDISHKMKIYHQRELENTKRVWDSELVGLFKGSS